MKEENSLENCSYYYYCEKCGRIIHCPGEDLSCENCNAIMQPLPKYWIEIRNISSNEQDKKDFIENVVKPNPKFDQKAYERTQLFLEYRKKGIWEVPTSIPDKIPESPKVSKGLIVYSVLSLCWWSYLFLYFPTEIHEKPEIFAWLGVIGLLICLPIYIHYGNYMKAKEYRELACQDFEAYQRKFIEDEIERRKNRNMNSRNNTMTYISIKCPNCGSTNTKKISTLNRAVSVGTVGLASSKIGKQFECNSCKYKW